MLLSRTRPRRHPAGSVDGLVASKAVRTRAINVMII
jgi:hypothetical protein